VTNINGHLLDKDIKPKRLEGAGLSAALDKAQDDMVKNYMARVGSLQPKAIKVSKELANVQ
jgi:hypothetical protein